jgi:hypothetical protein
MPRTAHCHFLVVVIVLITVSNANGRGIELPWVGAGAYRFVVQVDAEEQQTVEIDERPAQLSINLAERLQQLGIQQTPNLNTLQVIQHENVTGQAVVHDGYAYALSPFDRAFRWYDGAIPYEFPEMADAVSRTKGRIIRKPQTRTGYFYNVLGDWQSGRLVWMHTSVKGQKAVYGIYFDLLDAGATPSQIPPRAWAGDGTPRCDRTGSSTTGSSHTRIDLDDWDGDGLVDIVAGESYGHLFWWPNVGTRERPEFRFSRFIVNSDNQPLDAGLGSAPKVVDWDGDGTRDLLVGTHWNRLLYYRNVGTNAHRQFKYHGPVTVHNEPLEVPFKPLVRGSERVFRRDYYPIPECVDWDNDGDVDLLLGGYVTGRIFFYENTGRHPDGTPVLEFGGPITADGQPVNVEHWCAAPCAVDINSDGYIDLLSGNMPMHVQPDERDQYEDTFLQLYVGGTKSDLTGSTPDLSHSTFPRKREFPRGRLATPRAADWDADGDFDLVVSTGEDIYLFRNSGSAVSPAFDVGSQPIRVPWGTSRVTADQFRDWDDDGDLDIMRNYTVRLNSGDGNPYHWDDTVNVLPRGEYIEHPSHTGDDWFRPHLDDFDEDGRIDVLFGDWFGHVWFHRNLSTAESPHFDVEGFRFELSDGTPIKVGPVNKDPEKSFDALQGARTVLTAGDFDRDGRQDLVIGDTYGIVRYFRNLGPVDDPEARVNFAEPIEVGDLGIRGLVDTTDWNRDGWPDVIASSANGRVRVFLNTKDQGVELFAEGIDPQLPPISQPRVIMVDLNGDGDEDMYLPSTLGACFIERSFLERGYAQATILKLETAPPDR